MDTTKVKWIADIDDLSFEQLRVEFMRMSPSYQLINEWINDPVDVCSIYIKAIEKSLPHNIKRGLFDVGTKKLSNKQLKSFKKLFESTLDTYLEYGDINKPYSQWWKERGHLIFDSSINSSGVKDLGTIDCTDVKNSSNSIRKSIESLSQSAISRHHLILSVPMYMLHKDAMTQISQLLNESLLSTPTQKRLRKPLLGQRFRTKPLVKKLKLMMYRCMYPDETLIQIGKRAEISKNNQIKVDNVFGNYTHEQIELAKRHIGLSASRALSAAESIAEKASRDKFPDGNGVAFLEFDWELCRKNLLKAWPALKG